MIGLGKEIDIHLDAERFANDDETYRVAIVVTKHAEKRRANYRATETPGMYHLLQLEPSYWSDSVPWHEWMSEPQILQPCAEECGLKIWQLAGVIAFQIRPNNWQVFSWMSVALQGREYEEVITGALSHHMAQIGKMREQSQSDARVSLAKAGAKARHASDPKQAAKSQVKEDWEAWKRQPADYASNADFALDMLRNYSDLKSQAVIARWCSEWETQKP